MAEYERIYCEDHDRVVRDHLPAGSSGAVRREIERYDETHRDCNLMLEVVLERPAKLSH